MREKGVHVRRLNSSVTNFVSSQIKLPNNSYLTCYIIHQVFRNCIARIAKQQAAYSCRKKVTMKPLTE